MDSKECPKCGATWIDGEHYWSGTGKKGSELDLAGLVCNALGDESCINDYKGMKGGQTWEEREREAEALLKEWEDKNL